MGGYMHNHLIIRTLLFINAVGFALTVWGGEENQNLYPGREEVLKKQKNMEPDTSTTIIVEKKPQTEVITTIKKEPQAEVITTIKKEPINEQQTTVEVHQKAQENPSE